MALRFLLALAALACAVTGHPARAQTNSADSIVYTVRQGDNLYALAERYLIRIADYRAVQRLNAVANPYRLRVGSRLRMPKALLRFDRLPARIIAFRGDVRIQRASGTAGAALGAQVSEGERVITGANSFVTLQLPDESAVALPSQSQVEIRRLRRILITGGVERQFALIRGRARAIVQPLERQEDEFRFLTPVAVTAVRGTEFRVTFDPESARGTSEVLKGLVDVGSADGSASREVAAGFGALSSTEGLSEVLALLPAPGLLRPGRVQDDEELRFELEPLPGAASYRVQIARDAGFLDVVAETLSDATAAILPAVEDGTWFVRVSALDPNGLEGRYETHSFQRRLNRIEAALETRDTGRFKEYLFRWRAEGAGRRQYRFEMRRGDEEGPVIVDEPGLTAQRFIITDLPAGTYSWRVQTLQFADGEVFAKWSAPERLNIAPDE